MLARRALTRAEVESRLIAKVGEAISSEAMGRLDALRVLDDEALAMRMVDDALARRGLGRHRIRAELLRRGIAAEMAERIVDEAVMDDAERAAATAALARFRKARSGVADPRKATAAAYRHLVSRGFPAGLVRDLLGVSL
jgi:regulatory protein